MIMDTWCEIDDKATHFEDIDEKDFPSCFDKIRLMPEKKGFVVIARKPFMDIIIFDRLGKHSVNATFVLDNDRKREQNEERFEKQFYFGSRSFRWEDDYCHDALKWYHDTIFREEG